jgi:DNA-binding CsgD family transcriptional regulator
MCADSLSDIIMAVYECALAPAGWYKALRRIAEFSGSAGCRIVVDSPRNGSVVYVVEHGIESQSTGHRLDGERNPDVVSATQLLPLGEPVALTRMAGQVRIGASGEPWYDQGDDKVADVLAVVLLRSDTGSVILEAMRTESLGYYTERDLERIRQISPHVCRAVSIIDSLNASRLASGMFEASLEALSAGVYVIARRNRVVYLNRAARAQIKSGKVLRLADDQLVAVDRDAQRLLQAELQDIENRADQEASDGRAIALPDGSGSGYVAQVLPLRGGEHTHIASHFAAIAAIFVQDPAAAPMLANSAFAQLYGLTDGELRLLNGLVPGLTLAEIAALLGISEATAKTHLRHIFAKTKTSKQTELLHLLIKSTPPTSGS